MEYRIETKCLHLEEKRSREDSYGAVSFPIYQTAAFAHKGVGGSTGYDYSRLQNPTREQLEKTMASLEKGIDALAFSSGMAAVAALMECFGPGDHLLVDSDLYGGSIRLFQTISKKNGVEITDINVGREDVEQYLQANTKAVYIETPTNPMMNVTDIRKLSLLTKERGLLLIVDNTFLSPYFQNPLELGADVVIHSGTKYLGGHNDTLAGFLVTNREEISERLRFIFKTTGAGLAPMDSWLIQRGIKTLALRMERAQKNAFALAGWLKNHRRVTRVIYPGLEDHPGYAVMKEQARGFGGMLTFEVDSKELAFSLLNHVELIQYAESLGGVESLITYPITQTHADVPAEKLRKNGITDRLLRMSVGIENVQDLIEELERVFTLAEEELYGGEKS